MAKGNGGELALPALVKTAPCMNQALQTFLAQQSLPALGNFQDVDIEQLWQAFDKRNQVEIASRIIQGYCLARIRAASVRDFVDGLKRRGKPINSAYRLIATFQLFDALPDLELLCRAAEFDVIAILTIANTVGLKALPDLLSGKEVAGLTLETAKAMSTRELEDWRKEVLEKDVAIQRERQGRIDAEALLEAAQHRLHALSENRADRMDSSFAALRDQAAFLTCKMFEESAILARLAADKLIVPDWRNQEHAEDRQAVATTFYHALNGVAANIAQVLLDLQAAFGNYVTAGVHPTLKYAPKMRERLLALREEALSAAEREFHDAQIDARMKHKVRGRHR